MAVHEQLTLLEDLKRAAWGRTSPVGNHASAWEFRKDRLGNMVRWADYGNRKSPFGWELDYIEPKAIGGSNDPENLQAMHWRAIAARSENVPAALVASPVTPRLAAA
jgi:hypothetical protein